MAPELKKDVDCMVGVLRTVPGVDNVKVKFSREPKGNSAADQNWTYPYIEYRTSNRDGQKGSIVFIAERQLEGGHAIYYFSAMLNGLSVTGQKPDDWGTSTVTRLWKNKCGVDVSVLYN